MKITVLVDNVAGGKFKAEHGVSYLIQHKQKTILFDVGHSNLFIANALAMGIDLHEVVDQMVLSHGHWDHGNGLKHFSGKPLLMHPKAFIKRYRKTDRSPIGIDANFEKLKNQYDITFAKKPFYISDDVLFLGEVPSLNDFEAMTTPFIDEDGKPDFVPDDSALVIIENGELNIITGCSHSGICNIIAYAKKVTYCEKVNSVVGGFHLKHDNEQSKQTVAYLNAQNVKHIYPSHCTELPALSRFYQAFKIQQLKVGMQLNL